MTTTLASMAVELSEVVAQVAQLAVADAGEREGDEDDERLATRAGSASETSSLLWFRRVNAGAWLTDDRRHGVVLSGLAVLRARTG